jgi:hypothetical protein
MKISERSVRYSSVDSELYEINDSIGMKVGRIFIKNTKIVG